MAVRGLDGPEVVERRAAADGNRGRIRAGRDHALDRPGRGLSVGAAAADREAAARDLGAAQPVGTAADRGSAAAGRRQGLQGGPGAVRVASGSLGEPPAAVRIASSAQPGGRAREATSASGRGEREDPERRRVDLPGPGAV
jgi:hypothetical protein